MWLWLAGLTAGCIGVAVLLARIERVRIRPFDEVGPGDDGHIEG